jgi:general secretion pathway protein K
MAPTPNNLRARPGEEGAVLLLIILVLTMISVLVLSWGQEWRTELKLAANFEAAHRSQRLAEAGVYYALGKLVTAVNAETVALQGRGTQPETPRGDIWWPDQRLHRLELPDGQVEVRIADEAGKINLNLAPEGLLGSFLATLGLSELRIRIMVDSLQDWRTKEEFARPYGAKSAYYLGLQPPYVAKNGKFETVEELAWVRGFEGSPLIPRLHQWFTVQNTGGAINLNTAPLEVILALGFPGDAARMIMATRQAAPLRGLQDVPQLQGEQLLTQNLRLSFRNSPFFTIISTGMVKNSKGRYTIKTIVRLNINQEVPWMVLSWYDGFPG